jgi:NADH-quinone oxidoreductase subunit A
VLLFEKSANFRLAEACLIQPLGITVLAVMDDAATGIDGGVNRGMARGAVLGLNVEDEVAQPNIAIESKYQGTQLFRRADRQGRAAPPARICLTGLRSHRYYSSDSMTSSYLGNYLPLLIHLLVAMALAGALLTLSSVVGTRRPSQEKSQPYECGMQPVGDARQPFDVKFYLVAILFILFDVEAIFFYPWAYVYRDLRMFGFYEMLLYMGILVVGYVYLLKKGALNWNK